MPAPVKRGLSRDCGDPLCGYLRCFLVFFFFIAVALPAQAASMNEMDHGPFVTWTIRGPDTLTYKGIAIKVDSKVPAAVCFDTDLLRYSVAWTGGFLQWYPERDGLERHPTVEGQVQWNNAAGPGWSSTGQFEDPRPMPYGPLPDEWGRYRGLYRHGEKIVLAYTVGDGDILENPDFENIGDRPFFIRTFNLKPASEALSLRIGKVAGSSIEVNREEWGNDSGSVRIGSTAAGWLVGYRGLPDQAEWEIVDQHLVLRLPRLNEAARFQLWVGPSQDEATDTVRSGLKTAIRESGTLPDLAAMCEAGPALWEPALVTQGQMGVENGPLAVDTLTVPHDNPWNSWIRCTGLDFLSDDRALVASVSGDLWLVSGIQEKLGELKWKRFATGLYQPLGVKVVGEEIYVLGRDQLTRLHDFNQDGEADYYENFNNDCMVAENFHEYTMNLETDAAGNFYYTKGAPWPPDVKTPHQGVLFKLDPQGEQLETYATGLRGPDGLGIGPDGTILFSDNEGHWLPTCSLQWARKGGFHGMKPTAHTAETPDDFAKPICWIPHSVDNSPGDPIWVPKGHWGPLAGKVLLTSYGKSTLSLVLMETVNGVRQGGIMNLPLNFRSGLIRGRYHTDGHLYLCGLRVWQSNGIEYGALHRVRYTGKPMHLPLELHARSNGIELRFSCKLDRESATDPQNYSMEQWNYRWIGDYGSPHYSVKNPEEKGHDRLPIESVQLADDQKTILIKVPELQPVMQMHIRYNVRAEDGERLRQDIYNTIHRVP